jgi:hypothetical protein
MKKVVEWGLPALALIVLGGVGMVICFKGRAVSPLPLPPAPPAAVAAALPAGAVSLPPRFFCQLLLPQTIMADKPVVIEFGGGAAGTARLELGLREVTLQVPGLDLQRAAWTPLSNAKVMIGRQNGRLIIVQGALAVADFPGAGDWRWICGRGGAGMPAPAFQKTAPVFFDDDFMHEDSFGEWQRVSGQWKINQVGKTVGGSPLRSPNAFSLSGENDAVIQAGQWFWNNYTAAVSAIPGSEAGFGFLFCCRDSANRYRVDWGRKLVLSKIVDGRTTVLGEAAASVVPLSWCRLEVSSLHGHLTVKTDGVTVLEVYDPQPIFAGGIGLVVPASAKVTFDDVRVRPVSEWHWRRQDGVQGLALPLAAVAADAASLPGFECSGLSLQNCQVAVTLAGLDRLQDPVEIRCRCQGTGEGPALRISRRPQGLIGELLGSDRTRLAGFPLPAGLPGTTTLVLHALKDELWVSQAGRELGRARLLESPQQGGVRVLSAVNPSLVTAVDIVPEEGLADVADMLEIFRREIDGEMGAWATAMGEWSGGNRQGLACYTHRSDFWGDCALDLNLEKLSAATREKPFGLAILSPEGVPMASQLRLEVVPVIKGPVPAATPPPNSGAKTGTPADVPVRWPGARLRLWSGKQMIKELELPEMPRQLTLERRSPSLLVRADGELLWDETLPASLGSLAALARFGEGSPAKWADAAKVRAKGIRTWSFKEAPWEWRIQGGTWRVANRWNCDPRWSFFSGSNKEGLACLWNKFECDDNVTLEFFAAPKMQTENDATEYRYGGDFNVSMGTDGRDLDGGLSWLGFRKGEKGSVMYVKKKLMAECHEQFTILPTAYTVHHRWYHFKIRRQGNAFTLWIDGNKAFSTTVTEPLAGNRFALWTWKNAIMIAQVRLSQAHDFRPAGDFRQSSFATPAVPPGLP